MDCRTLKGWIVRAGSKVISPCSSLVSLDVCMWMSLHIIHISYFIFHIIHISCMWMSLHIIHISITYHKLVIAVWISHKHVIINICEHFWRRKEKSLQSLSDAIQITFSYSLTLCRLQKKELEGVREQPVLPVDFHWGILVRGFAQLTFIILLSLESTLDPCVDFVLCAFCFLLTDWQIADPLF